MSPSFIIRHCEPWLTLVNKDVTAAILFLMARAEFGKTSARTFVWEILDRSVEGAMHSVCTRSMSSMLLSPEGETTSS